MKDKKQKNFFRRCREVAVRAFHDKVVMVSSILAALMVFADSVKAAAIDVTGIGASLVADIGTAGAEGLLVFAGLFGIVVVVRAFRSAAG